MEAAGIEPASEIIDNNQSVENHHDKPNNNKHLNPITHLENLSKNSDEIQENDLIRQLKCVQSVYQNMPSDLKTVIAHWDQLSNDERKCILAIVSSR